MSGCAADLRRENDVLRAEVLRLERQVDDLGRRNAELARELERLAAERKPLPPEGRPDREEMARQEEAWAAAPHVTEIRIDRLSRLRDTTGDGAADTAVVYVRPRDGWGRFTQVVGTVHVEVFLLPRDAEPMTLGREAFGPLAVREAYRSGLLGTHYTLEARIDWPVEIDPQTPGQAIIRAWFTDAETGEELHAERTVRVP